MYSEISFQEGYLAMYDYSWVWNPFYHTFKFMTDENYAKGVEVAWARKIEDLKQGIY